MKTSYQVVSKKDRAKLAEFLAKEGQQLLPRVDLVEQSKLAVDEMVDVMGPAVVEAVRALSAISVAGERHQGQAGGAVRRHGRQGGVVRLSERKLRVERPRPPRAIRLRARAVAAPARRSSAASAGGGGSAEALARYGGRRPAAQQARPPGAGARV